MKKMRFLEPKSLALLSFIAIYATIAFPLIPSVHAPGASSNVGVISNFDCVTHPGPTFPTLAGFSFVFLAHSPLPSLTPYDTVFLNVCSSLAPAVGSPGLNCDTANLSLPDKAALASFVTSSGGKLLIYDSECKPGVGVDYSWLPSGLSMSTSNPGGLGINCATAAACDLFKTPGEPDSTLSAQAPLSSFFINDARAGFVGPVETVGQLGDANVMTSAGNLWCGDLDAKNTLGATGHVHTYSKPLELGGLAGLVIYNGLDMNLLTPSSLPGTSTAGGNLAKLLLQELNQPWNLSGLTCGAPITGVPEFSLPLVALVSTSLLAMVAARRWPLRTRVPRA